MVRQNDKITLSMLKQIGVEGIVTALHDVPNGEVWTREKYATCVNISKATACAGQWLKACPYARA